MRALPRETIIEHQHLVISTPPLAQQPGAGFELRACPEASGLLQFQPDLAKMALQLQTRPTRGNLLHPVGNGTHQQLTAETRRGVGFVELAPQLAEFAEIETGEARQHLRAALVVLTRHSPSPLAGRFEVSDPIDRPVISILAARHHATGLAEPSDGGSHGVRQPTELLPDLGNRGALGPLKHHDQLGALRASRWLISTPHTARPRIGAPRRGLCAYGSLSGFVVNDRTAGRCCRCSCLFDLGRCRA